MKIKIHESKKEQLAALIKAAEGRASSRTISLDVLFAQAKRAEKFLEENLFLNQKDRCGAKVKFGKPGPYKSSYTYYPVMRTEVTLQRGSKDWFLVRVERGAVFPNKSETFDIAIPELAAKKATTAFQKQFMVKAA